MNPAGLRFTVGMQKKLICVEFRFRILAHWESPWYPPDMGVRKWASKDRINE